MLVCKCKLLTMLLFCLVSVVLCSCLFGSFFMFVCCKCKCCVSVCDCCFYGCCVVFCLLLLLLLCCCFFCCVHWELSLRVKNSQNTKQNHCVGWTSSKTHGEINVLMLKTVNTSRKRANTLSKITVLDEHLQKHIGKSMFWCWKQ